MLNPKTRAPDFSLPNQNDQTITLSEVLNRGPLILYFYPADFTPGCTKEACSIRDLHDEISKVGLQVIGVSPQSSESHRRFRDKHSLQFDLLSDSDKKVIKAYNMDGPLGFGVRRATFLIGANGMIDSAVLADLRIAEHDAFIRRALQLRAQR